LITSFLTDMISSPGGRQHNEDHCSFLAAGELSCWVLADGLGGPGGGEVASQLACDTALRAFQQSPEVSSRAVESYINAANRAILERQQTDPALMFMASTVVVLAADQSLAVWGHAGDSRLYHLRGGKIVAQTKDHSVAQALVDGGEIQPVQIRFHPDRSSLQSSLGRKEQPGASTLPKPIPVQPGDAFLLASDGFWELLTEVEMEIEYSKARTPSDWLRGMEFRLFRKIAAESDNYSAVAVFAV
jgi:serine/threonine protein phosphatase PrpC